MTFTVSASQVEDFYTCQRKWGLRRLARYTQNIGAFRGESAHGLLEAWGQFRTPPEQGEARIAVEVTQRYPLDLAEKQISAQDYAARIVAVVNKMIPLLPDPPWERVEQKLRTVVDGVQWTGRIDLEYSNHIDDHKITASKEYALTEETIRTNVQALIYAHDLLTRKSCSEVNIGWTYGMPGAKPRAWRVESVFTAAHVAEHLPPHNETGKRIVQLRVLNPNPLTLPPNWKSCSAYGGCEYQHICQPTAEQLMSAYMADSEQGDETMGLLSQLKTNASPAPAPTPSTPTPEPAPAPAAATPPVAGSDHANAVADCKKNAIHLMGLGLARDEVVKSLKQRYVGLSLEDVEGVVPAPVAVNPTTTPAPETTAPVSNGQPSSPEAPKEEAKRGRKTKADTAGESTDPWHAARISLIDRILADNTLTSLEAANALSMLRA